jgi:hypothetical protein
MWKRVDWTDAALFTTGAFGKVYVTQTAEENFAPDYLVSKFAGFSSAMAYEVISGMEKSLILMDKEWGKISAKIYIKRVLPHFYKHLQEIAREVGFMGAILIENNASILQQS